MIGIEWHDSGYFRFSTAAICAKGVAGDVAALAEFARRAGALTTSRVVYEASDAFGDIGYDPEVWSLARHCFEDDFERKRGDKSALSQLRLAAESLPADRKALVQLAKARAAVLNEVAPLVPHRGYSIRTPPV